MTLGKSNGRPVTCKDVDRWPSRNQADAFAQAILAALPVGGSLPFFDGVVGNMIGLVKEPGSNGLVGLIALGLIMWLFSKRTLA